MALFWLVLWIHNFHNFNMPRSKPITRSSNQDPVHVALNCLEECIKYLQRCYRRSERKNLQLELELKSLRSDISEQQEKYKIFSLVNRSGISFSSGLQERITTLQNRKLRLERELYQYRKKYGAL